jgi:hypothetical protein
MTIKIKGKTMFLFIAGVGIVTTAWLAAKNTPEAQKRKEAALAEKRLRTGDPNAQLTFIESVRAQIGAYMPTIASMIVTVGGLVGSEYINEKNFKKCQNKIDEFKDMTDKIGGKGTSQVIEKAVEQKKLDEKNHKPWEHKECFRIVFQGKSIQFESTRADIMSGIYETNRQFHNKGIITFNELLQNFGQDPVAEGDERGWESYIGEIDFGYTWIDIGLKECEDEPWVTEIFMAVYPHPFDGDARLKDMGLVV